MNKKTMTQKEFVAAFYQREAALFDLLAHHLFTQFILVNPETKKSDEPLHDLKQLLLPKSAHDEVVSFVAKFNYKNFCFGKEVFRPDYSDSTSLLKVGRVCVLHAEMCRQFVEDVDFELLMKIDDVSSRLLGIAHGLAAYCAALGDEEADFLFKSSH